MHEYVLNNHHVILLTKACESLDRIEEARDTIKSEGLTYRDRLGSPRANPAVAIERDNKIAVARLFRELGLDLAGDGNRRRQRCRQTGDKAMPIRERSMARRGELKETEEAWLRGDREGSGFIKFKRPELLQELWERHGDPKSMHWEPGMRLPHRMDLTD